MVHRAAEVGYDCIWLDLEHRSITPREVEILLAHCHLHDIDCMVRPPTKERTRLYRYLEDGATGLLIPHVSTEEEARRLVGSTKFPPIGDRSFDGTGFDSDFGSHDLEAYAEWANRETFLAVQIESVVALENVEKIAAVPGVDMLFVGPGDLGYRLRHDESGSGDPDGGVLEDAYVRVAEAARAHGIAWGCPTSGSDTIAHRRSQGCGFIANTSDWLLIQNGLSEAVAEFG
jgi:2-keto-3-deoxy-L-rhamnonate aldolase RhmA